MTSWSVHWLRYLVWWLAVVGMGWLITDGPLNELGVSEEQHQQGPGVGAHVVVGRRHALLLADRRDRQHHRCVPGRGRADLVADQAMVVRGRTADRDQPAGHGLLLHHPAHRPRAARRGEARRLAAHLQLPERAHRRRYRAVLHAGVPGPPDPEPGAAPRGGRRVPGDPAPRGDRTALPRHAPPQRHPGGHRQRLDRGPARLVAGCVAGCWSAIRRGRSGHARRSRHRTPPGRARCRAGRPCRRAGPATTGARRPGRSPSPPGAGSRP